ncbi:MAG: phytoene desaturase family protein [Hyphomicrobiaceae bacterium]|nr:phytoene desaturase family protein [Hyphomicrobiaceae bacterium]
MDIKTLAATQTAPAGDPGRAAVVIGAGLGGIAAALRLRAKGYAVTLVERGPRIGGRAQVFEKDGFRHDAGPTVITAPFLFDELFELFGKKREDYVTFVPLDPWYRFRFQDGTTFDYGGTVEDTLREIRRFEPDDADGYLRLLEHSKKLFQAGFTELADQPFHNLETMLAQVPRLASLRADRTVWQLISTYLKNPKLRQAFSIQPLLVGGDPFQTTSIYGLIHYLERQWGVYFAMGGTGALIAAFEKLMREEGIDLRLSTTVDQILLRQRTVTGVRLADGTEIAAATVVSNCDPLHLYENMLPEHVQGPALRLKRRSRLSMGLYVLYFGTRRTYPDVAHHTIWFGPRYQEHLADIFRRGILADDFSLYVHRPTATDPSFAPPGCDSFYVLCPVPNTNAGIDWAVEGPKLKARIVAALEATMLPGLSAAMVADFAMTPDDFADRYLSVAGAGFSISPHFTQSAWFRFHNKSESIAGLYLVGAGTHPGAGMPGVVSSAKVVERLIPAVG